MIRRLVAALTGAFILAAGTLALAVPASAGDYNFPSDCTAADIVENNGVCVSSVLVMDVDSEGDVEWVVTSAYPRQAFDELVFEVERHTGTTEEYLDSITTDAPGDEADYDYTLDDDLVTLTITIVFTQASADATGAGVTLLDDTLLVQIEPSTVVGMAKVTVNTPGPVIESNGRTEGHSVVWGSSELLAGVPLTAQAETSPGFYSQRLLLAGIFLLVVAAVVALYFLRSRKQGESGASPVDFDPVFEEDVDQAADPDSDHGTHTELAGEEPTTTDKPQPDAKGPEEQRD